MPSSNPSNGNSKFSLSWFDLIEIFQAKKKNCGFTLLELIVVMMIISILTAVSLPAFIRQIGKSRETDAKIALGSIIRSQQAYHFEKGSFASSNEQLSINGQFFSNYYTFTDPKAGDDYDVVVRHQAIATNPSVQSTRHYSVGTYFNNGLYSMFMCQGKEIADPPVESPVTDSGTCTNDGIQVK